MTIRTSEVGPRASIGAGDPFKRYIDGILLLLAGTIASYRIGKHERITKHEYADRPRWPFFTVCGRIASRDRHNVAWYQHACSVHQANIQTKTFIYSNLRPLLHRQIATPAQANSHTAQISYGESPLFLNHSENFYVTMVNNVFSPFFSVYNSKLTFV